MWRGCSFPLCIRVTGAPLLHLCLQPCPTQIPSSRLFVTLYFSPSLCPWRSQCNPSSVPATLCCSHIWSIPGAGCPPWYLGRLSTVAGPATAPAGPYLCSQGCGMGCKVGAGCGAAGARWKPHVCDSEDFLMCQSQFKGNSKLLIEEVCLLFTVCISTSAA